MYTDKNPRLQYHSALHHHTNCAHHNTRDRFISTQSHSLVLHSRICPVKQRL